MGSRSKGESPLRSRVLVIVVVVAVSIVGIALDRILLREGVPRYDLLAISNAFTGIVAGGFFSIAGALTAKTQIHS